MRRLALLLLLLLVTAGWPGPVVLGGPGEPYVGPDPDPVNPISASAIASQTSCTAPCYVFMDATGTEHTITAVVPYIDLDYVWYFGDSVSDTWDTDSKTKDSQASPIAGHVYTAAGTFTPCVDVTDEAGNPAHECASPITVTAANTTFSGTKTYCIANGTTPVAGVNGCPTGASVVDNGDFDAVLLSTCSVINVDTVKRCLFKRGDSFTCSVGTNVLQTGPIEIGAYGDSGAKPVVTMTSSSPIFALGDGTGQAKDITIQGIRFVGTGADNGDHAIIRQITDRPLVSEHILLYDLEIDGFGSVMQNTANGTTPANDQVALVDITITNPGTRGIGFQTVTRGFFGGIDADNTGASSGHARIRFAHKFAIQHNRMYGDNGAQHVFKVPGTQTMNTVNPQVEGIDIQKYWDFSDNYMYAEDDGIGGYNTNAGALSTMQLLIIERNEFIRPNAGLVYDGCWFNFAFRNNVVLDTSGGTTSPINLWTNSSGGDQCNVVSELPNIHVYNNTFYSSSAATPNAVDMSAWVVDSFARNNIYFTPNDATPEAVITDLGTGNTLSNNWATDDDEFVGSTFTTPADLVLESGHTSVGAAFDFDTSDEDGEALYRDFSGTLWGGSYNPGAWIEAP